MGAKTERIVADGRQDASKSAQTSIVLERSTKEGSPLSKGETLTIPTWTISLVKVCLPAFIVLVTMYIRIGYIATDSEKMGGELKIQGKDLTEIKSNHAIEIQQLNAKIGLLEVQQKNDTQRVVSGLARIEIQMKEYKTEIREDIAVIQTDVKDLQQRIPKLPD